MRSPLIRSALLFALVLGGCVVGDTYNDQETQPPDEPSPTEPPPTEPDEKLNVFVFAHGFASNGQDAFDEEIIAAITSPRVSLGCSLD